MEEQKTNPKVEAMLRRWGAEEFASSLRPAAPGARPALRISPWRARLPWIVAAVAAAAVVAVMIALSAAVAGRREEMASANSDIKELRGRLDKARSESSTLQNELASSTGSLQSLQNQIEAMRNDDANRAQRELRAAGQATDLTGKLAARQAELDKQALEVARLKELAAGETARLADANARLQAATMAASLARDEAARLSRQQEEAVAAGRAAAATIEQLRLRQTALWNDVERAYFAATAPRESGLRALQVSIVQSRLNERIALARKAARTDSTRRLLDRVEVLTARLEMLELGNYDTEDVFRGIVRKSELVKQLELALENRVEPPEVLGVLFEARLILGGVQRAG